MQIYANKTRQEKHDKRRTRQQKLHTRGSGHKQSQSQSQENATTPQRHKTHNARTPQRTEQMNDILRQMHNIIKRE